MQIFDENAMYENTKNYAYQIMSLYVCLNLTLLCKFETKHNHQFQLEHYNSSLLI